MVEPENQRPSGSYRKCRTAPWRGFRAQSRCPSPPCIDAFRYRDPKTRIPRRNWCR
ncbi:hypothetical protein L493_3888 [Bordetella bronchiseptica 99-R-0433]|nr:hypothetical protein L493_3888 [Bordetella bronchiseptica 99-R-0433]